MDLTVIQKGLVAISTINSDLSATREESHGIVGQAEPRNTASVYYRENKGLVTSNSECKFGATLTPLFEKRESECRESAVGVSCEGVQTSESPVTRGKDMKHLGFAPLSSTVSQ